MSARHAFTLVAISKTKKIYSKKKAIHTHLNKKWKIFPEFKVWYNFFPLRSSHKLQEKNSNNKIQYDANAESVRHEGKEKWLSKRANCIVLFCIVFIVQTNSGRTANYKEEKIKLINKSINLRIQN